MSEKHKDKLEENRLLAEAILRLKSETHVPITRQRNVEAATLHVGAPIEEDIIQEARVYVDKHPGSRTITFTRSGDDVIVTWTLSFLQPFL